MKPSLNSRRFDQLVAFVIDLLDKQLRKFSHPSSPWLIGILFVSSCDRCIGPEKNFLIKSPTSLANDFQAVSWARHAESPVCRKPRLPEVRLIEDFIKSQLQSREKNYRPMFFAFQTVYSSKFKITVEKICPSYDLPFGTVITKPKLFHVVERKMYHARQTFEINCHL